MLNHPYIRIFIHPKIFIKRVVCARHCSRLWGYNSEQDRSGLCSRGAHILVAERVNKETNKQNVHAKDRNTFGMFEAWQGVLGG